MVASLASTSSALRGRPEPRLWTRPARELTPETSLGFEAADFIEEILGISLLPWQRWWLIHALETTLAGSFRFRTVITLVGRQSGKTTLLKALALWMMYAGRAKLVLGAAQSLDIARESWSGAVDLATDDPDLKAEIAKIRRANGEQELKLVNGARYKITATKRSSGRGLSVDLLILDELREHRDWAAWAALSKTTMARPNGLTVGISNAGDDESVVLNSLRDSALAGTDRLGIFEWSAPDDCDLDDPEAWEQASPGLGHTIDEGSIRAAMEQDSPAVFRTEILCQRVESMADSAVPAQAWDACLDKSMTLGSLRTRVALCVDVAPDLAHATLAMAAVGPDGRVRVDAVAAWTSVRQMVAELPGWQAKIKPAAFGWFPAGPAAGVKADLDALGLTAIPPADTSAACQEFAEQVISRRLLHRGDQLLTAHVVGAKRWNVGDGWRFVRRGVGHVDAAYAAAGAVRLARTLPPAKRVMLVTAEG